MKIISIQGKNFKSYEFFDLRCDAQCVGISGANSTGKTTLLDAIHYIGLTKSFLQASDKDCIKYGENYFHLQADVQSENENFLDTIFIYADLQKGKKIKVNDKWLSRFSTHIGFLPIILISPADISIVSDSAEHRRKFFDAFISQFDPKYLSNLIEFNKILAQRNALLKQPQTAHFTYQLDFFDQKLIETSLYIHEHRKHFVNEVNEKLPTIHQQLTHTSHVIEIQYQSSLLEEDYTLQLKRNLRRDIELGYTEKGIHRDEYHFLMDGYSLRKYGSQGQQKTFLLALKIAQYQETALRLHKKPLFLLDDIFDKLDEFRIKNLFDMLSQLNVDQLFITDTSENRLRNFLAIFSSQKLFFLENPGIIKEIK